MDETQENQNTTVKMSSTEAVSLEPELVIVEPAPVGDFPVYVVAATLLVAFVLSLFVRRLGRINAATRVRRWLPLLHVTIWSSAVVFSAFSYASALPDYWVVILALFIVVMVFASVGWLRSVTAGIAIAIEARLKIGDAIRIGETEGEIVAFSMRSVRLRSVDGTVHEIPNEKFMAESVANLSGDGGDSACEITLKIPPRMEPSRALALARNAAILTPLASPQHMPEVFLNATDERDQSFEIQIRGYAFDPTYQDHYRSDVISRFHDDYRLELARRSGQGLATASGLVLAEE